MKILVCLKQVPDSTVRVKVAPDGRAILTEGITWAISPYDEYAIEVALERKDADPTTTVSVVAMGPARSRDALRQALAMGCDDATLVTMAAEEVGGLAAARALATLVTERKPDLVLCGKQASDDDQGLVGAALAEALGLPHVAMVTKLEPADGGAHVTKEVDGGHEVWKAPFPAVLLVHKSEKEPRYPSLPGIMKAKKKEIPEIALATLLGEGAAPPAVTVTRLEQPPARGGGKLLTGAMAQIATELATLLRDEAKVLS